MTIKWLLNVKLETNRYTDEQNYTYTKTDLFHLKITDGKITEIKSHKERIEDDFEKLNVDGLLAVPSFKEMHNHLDKTYLGIGWRSCIPAKNLAHRLALEAKELVELAPTTKKRASEMIETILSYGSTHIRTHVNIDPYIGLKNLEGVLEALDVYKGKVTADIIAFPQHGLLKGEVPALMREALRSGATMVGGLDPAGIDKNIEESLNTTMNLAQEFDVDVDFHIHDGGHVGWYTIDKWIDMVEEQKFKNRTAISHAFSIGDIPEEKAVNLAERLAKHDMEIMSTVPLNHTNPPIALLSRHGVQVNFGCDGFFDSWGPYDTGDVLQRATTYCEKNGLKDENAIAQSLKFITRGITPLDETGKQVWPKLNDAADFVFANAESSANLIAMKLKREAVMLNGNLVYGKI